MVSFCGDDEGRLRPACVQTGREEGGQCLKMWQIHTRAEAPRQRLDEWEPGPAPAGRSNWIWLRTGSIDGIPVTSNRTHVWFMCETDGAKGFAFGQNVLVTDQRPEPTLFYRKIPPISGIGFLLFDGPWILSYRVQPSYTPSKNFVRFGLLFLFTLQNDIVTIFQIVGIFLHYTEIVKSKYTS